MIQILLAALLISSSAIASDSERKTKILITTALQDSDHNKLRGKQYKEAFETFKTYGDIKNTYVVEALGKEQGFFEELLGANTSDNVLYSTKNNPKLKNHGINEAMTMLDAVEHFKFSDTDVILKITGRYKLTSNFLLETIKNESNNNAFFRKIRQNDEPVSLFKDPKKIKQLYCVGFAMQCEHLNEFLKDVEKNQQKLEEEDIKVEQVIREWTDNKKKHDQRFKPCYLKELAIQADIQGSTERSNQTGIYNF